MTGFRQQACLKSAQMMMAECIFDISQTKKSRNFQRRILTYDIASLFYELLPTIYRH